MSPASADAVHILRRAARRRTLGGEGPRFRTASSGAGTGPEPELRPASTKSETGIVVSVVKPVRGDFLAGISVALVLIPQALAYAKIAGVDPVHGLYAAVAAPIAVRRRK